MYARRRTANAKLYATYRCSQWAQLRGRDGNATQHAAQIEPCACGIAYLRPSTYDDAVRVNASRQRTATWDGAV